MQLLVIATVMSCVSILEGGELGFPLPLKVLKPDIDELQAYWMSVSPKATTTALIKYPNITTIRIHVYRHPYGHPANEVFKVNGSTVLKYLNANSSTNSLFYQDSMFYDKDPQKSFHTVSINSSIVSYVEEYHDQDNDINERTLLRYVGKENFVTELWKIASQFNKYRRRAENLLDGSHTFDANLNKFKFTYDHKKEEFSFVGNYKLIIAEDDNLLKAEEVSSLKFYLKTNEFSTPFLGSLNNVLMLQTYPALVRDAAKEGRLYLEDEGATIRFKVFVEEIRRVQPKCDPNEKEDGYLGVAEIGKGVNLIVKCTTAGAVIEDNPIITDNTSNADSDPLIAKYVSIENLKKEFKTQIESDAFVTLKPSKLKLDQRSDFVRIKKLVSYVDSTTILLHLQAVYNALDQRCTVPESNEKFEFTLSYQHDIHIVWLCPSHGIRLKGVMDIISHLGARRYDIAWQVSHVYYNGYKDRFGSSVGRLNSMVGFRQEIVDPFVGKPSGYYFHDDSQANFYYSSLVDDIADILGGWNVDISFHNKIKPPSVVVHIDNVVVGRARFIPNGKTKLLKMKAEVTLTNQGLVPAVFFNEHKELTLDGLTVEKTLKAYSDTDFKPYSYKERSSDFHVSYVTLAKFRSALNEVASRLLSNIGLCTTEQQLRKVHLAFEFSSNLVIRGYFHCRRKYFFISNTLSVLKSENWNEKEKLEINQASRVPITLYFPDDEDFFVTKEGSLRNVFAVSLAPSEYPAYSVKDKDSYFILKYCTVYYSAKIDRM